MDEIEFIFQTTAFDVETLVPQISRALEKRLQMHQQQMLPKLFQRSGDGKKKKKEKESRYDKAAREFLEGHAESLKEKEVQVCFSGEEMITVMGALEDLDQDAVTFDAIELVMETEDVFFVVYQGRGIVLQKKDLDLTMGTLDEFRDFVNRNIKPIISLIEEEKTEE